VELHLNWGSKKTPGIKSNKEKEDSPFQAPEGMWLKCRKCQEVLPSEKFEENLLVCPQCDHHERMPAKKRLEFLFDEGRYDEFDKKLVAADALKFHDKKPYKDRLSQAQAKHDAFNAFVSGRGKVAGRSICAGAFDFKFLGGSMGMVVGEKITRLFERALKHREAVIIFSSSGGARMQEGILSLMQMAKSSLLIEKLKDAGLPYISVLCDPTTGGVAASFAALGDITVSEPKALIGFAGPRVIEQTIKQELPEGFQRAEFLLEHGFLDAVVHRRDLKNYLTRVIDMLLP